MKERYSTEMQKSAEGVPQNTEWLTELKELRENYSAQTEVIGFFKSDNKQLDERMKEAKRLLKSAAKITKNLPCDDGNCSECVHNDNGYVCSEYEYFEWQYADEALKLIGEDENENS